MAASRCSCEHGRQRITLPPNTCKDCGGTVASGICEHGRLRSVCKDCTQTTQHTLRTPRILGFVDHLQKAVDHTLASREKREWSTTLVRMVDHPLQPVKKLWLVAGVETTLVLSEWSTTPSGVGEYLFFA